MSNRRFYLLGALVVAGLCFSGYLSGVKFFTTACALKEQCPYFLGYPACYYGFAMYVVMAIFFVQFLMGSVSSRALLIALRAVSGVGILFAGFFTFQELPKLFTEGIASYVLGLPSCAYGLLVYTAIFGISWLAARTFEDVPPVPTV